MRCDRYVAAQNKFELKLPFPADWNQNFPFRACGGFRGYLEGRLCNSAVRDWIKSFVPVRYSAYIRRRRTGQLAPGGKGSRYVIGLSSRTYGCSVLNWAAKCRDTSGRFLRDRNPLDGLKAPKERNPVRTVLSAEQFRALRAAAVDYSAPAERFVMLAWYTGRRSTLSGNFNGQISTSKQAPFAGALKRTRLARRHAGRCILS